MYLAVICRKSLIVLRYISLYENRVSTKTSKYQKHLFRKRLSDTIAISLDIHPPLSASRSWLINARGTKADSSNEPGDFWTPICYAYKYVFDNSCRLTRRIDGQPIGRARGITDLSKRRDGVRYPSKKRLKRLKRLSLLPQYSVTLHSSILQLSFRVKLKGVKRAKSKFYGWQKLKGHKFVNGP